MLPAFKDIPVLTRLPRHLCGPVSDPSLARDWWTLLLELSASSPIRISADRVRSLPLISKVRDRLIIADYELRSSPLALFLTEDRTLMTYQRDIYRARPIGIEMAFRLLAASYALPLREETHPGQVRWTSGRLTVNLPDSLLSLALTLSKARDYQIRNDHHLLPPVVNQRGLPKQHTRILLDLLLAHSAHAPTAFRVYQLTPKDTRLYFARHGSLEPLVRWFDGEPVRLNSLPIEIALRSLLKDRYHITYQWEGPGRITCRLKHRKEPAILGHGNQPVLALCDAARKTIPVNEHQV